MKIAYLFPGQGAQYPKMGKDFFDQFAVARKTFEEADDLLKKNLSKLIFEGSQEELTETKNSQVALYVTSMAMMRVIESEYPHIHPAVCSGLSLGEYSALAAASILSFEQALKLVEKRGLFMNEACLKRPGTMAVVLGLSALECQKFVDELNLPNDLWVANFNCPGQVVLSGTAKGIEIGALKAKEAGAKRVLPLQVHGAFHSPLMQEASKSLQEWILQAQFQKGRCPLVMNVSGKIVETTEEQKQQLIDQVTHSVRWEMGVQSMNFVTHYLEIGPGKSLSGFNKRIGVEGQTFSIEKIEDLKQLEGIG